MECFLYVDLGHSCTVVQLHSCVDTPLGASFSIEIIYRFVAYSSAVYFLKNRYVLTCIYSVLYL